MSTRILVIDDEKLLPHATHTAKNIHDGVKALQEDGPWDVLYLDYYLNEWSPRRTGMLVLNWLGHHQEFLPKLIIPNSSDEGRNREMAEIIKELYGRSLPDTL